MARLRPSPAKSRCRGWPPLRSSSSSGRRGVVATFLREVRSPPWYAPGPACSYPAVRRKAWCSRSRVVPCAAWRDLWKSTAAKLVLGSERGKRGWSSRRHASNHAPPLTRRLVRHLTEGPPPRFLLSVDPSACLFFVLTPDAAGFGYRCLLDWGPDR